MTAPRRDIRTWAPLMLLIQAVLHPERPKLDVDEAITLAEALDARLTSRGYGPTSAKAASAPRPLIDHLSALPAPQQASFAAFWAAFAYPKGKQAAAQRWGQIAPDAALAEVIIAAAAADAANPRPADAARKWAAGWLSERRWEDAPPRPGALPLDPDEQRRREVTELLAERRALAGLYRRHPDPSVAAQIAALDQRLNERGIDLAACAGHRPTLRPPRSSAPRAIADILKEAP